MHDPLRPYLEQTSHLRQPAFKSNGRVMPIGIQLYFLPFVTTLIRGRVCGRESSRGKVYNPLAPPSFGK